MTPVVNGDAHRQDGNQDADQRGQPNDDQLPVPQRDEGQQQNHRNADVGIPFRNVARELLGEMDRPWGRQQRHLGWDEEAPEIADEFVASMDDSVNVLRPEKLEGHQRAGQDQRGHAGGQHGLDRVAGAWPHQFGSHRHDDHQRDRHDQRSGGQHLFANQDLGRHHDSKKKPNDQRRPALHAQHLVESEQDERR